MPLKIVNNDGSLSLRDLQEKIHRGYSVVKSPHVGNQHPSNLVCASLGIPMHLVTFTSGERDKNFHPHLQIRRGEGIQISDPATWTPFAKKECGCSIESFHLLSLRSRFPASQVMLDTDLLRSDYKLSETVLRVMTNTNKRIWYRRVSSDGSVAPQKGNLVKNWDQINSDVYRFSDDSQGLIIPNMCNALLGFILQSQGSGKDVIYHLSGPQMVGYIEQKQKGLSKAYDALRQDIIGLPETLTVHVVPVASCRMVVHKSNKTALDFMEHTLGWYESLKPADKHKSGVLFSALMKLHPEFTDSIEEGRFLSHYDINSSDELVLSEWMLNTPLSQVEDVYNQMLS